MAKIFDKMFLNVLLLGVSFMLVFTAFQTCGMIQNIVITSMTEEYKGHYFGDGYISLAIVYAVFAISNWIAPSVISSIGPKISMLLGGITYCLFIGNFFFHETWCLYLASCLVGIGASIFWTGQGNFLTLNSDSETMSRNSGVFWALLQCSLLFGNLFIYFILQGKTEIDEHTRFLVFAVLLGIACSGILLLCFLRSGTTDSASFESSSNEPESSRVLQEFKTAVNLFKTKKMILLALTFFYTGLELSFFSGVYTTGVGKTKTLGDDSAKYVGVAGICIGVGEILGGALFGILGKKTNKYGRDPVILLGFLFHMVTFFLIFLNLPAKCTLHDTWQPAIIQSNVALVVVCGFGLGFGDACYNTQVYSILGSVYSDDSAPAFALFKFFQSIAAAAAFFYSTALNLYQQLLILVVTGTIGTFSFWIVEWHEYAKIAKQKSELKTANAS